MNPGTETQEERGSEHSFQAELTRAKDGDAQALRRLLDCSAPLLERPSATSVVSKAPPLAPSRNASAAGTITAIAHRSCALIGTALPSFQGRTRREFAAWLRTLVRDHLRDHRP